MKFWLNTEAAIGKLYPSISNTNHIKINMSLEVEEWTSNRSNESPFIENRSIIGRVHLNKKREVGKVK